MSNTELAYSFRNALKMSRGYRYSFGSDFLGLYQSLMKVKSVKDRQSYFGKLEVLDSRVIKIENEPRIVRADSQGEAIIPEIAPHK